MTVTDGEIVTHPHAEAEAAEAWMNLALKIGSDVGSMAAAGRRQHRRLMLPKAPLFASVVAAADGTATLDLGICPVGKEWDVRGLLVVDASNPGGVTSGGTVLVTSNTYAAGAASSTALPAGATMTGFDITTLPIAAEQSGTVSLLGMGVGTMSYELSEPAGGGQLSIRFPNPIPATDVNHFPQVNVPAIVSGAAYATTVYGLTATADATPGAGFWYTGIPSVYGPQTARWPISSLPAVVTKGSDHITVPAREHLFAVLTGCTPGHTLVARADIIEDTPDHTYGVFTH